MGAGLWQTVFWSLSYVFWLDFTMVNPFQILAITPSDPGCYSPSISYSTFGSQGLGGKVSEEKHRMDVEHDSNASSDQSGRPSVCALWPVSKA
jgi:hypothetical protein